jgi:tetratricopeptide (TPR) repeat protein
MKPTRVEFFPSQQDFAIRTFGSLGGQGLLGVCFGTVITMNSPGSLAAGRNNWESTLWHEYCHVVTLSITQNKMPRWLSEGISVYEEAQRDAAWGMAMTADWRARILDDKEPPVPMSRLSTAFMNPKDGDALMFAYFQSAMAVKFLIETHGADKFQMLLRQLASGTRINAALETAIMRTEELDERFQQALRKAANDYAPKADFTIPTREELSGSTITALRDYLSKKPNNVVVWKRLFAAQMEAKDWEAAIQTADRIHELEPLAGGSDSALWFKAKALSMLDRQEEELALLRIVADRSADAAAVFERLIEVERAAQDWEGLHRYAARAYALNPFLAGPNEALALASDSLGRVAEAIVHYERLLALDTGNAALIRYKLAQLHMEKEPERAKRYLLDALAEAPRFKLALNLLLELP